MTSAEVITIVGDMIGSFGLGFGLGLLSAAIKRALDFL